MEMNKKALTITAIAATALLGGCASTKDLEEVRTLAQQANQTALDAQAAAERAEAAANDAARSADEANRKIDNMFRKAMMK